MSVTRNVRTLGSAAILAGALGGCFTPTGDALGGPANSPVVAASGAGVGFTVAARDFTFDHSYAGPTRGDSVAVGLVVTNYTGGSALVEIVDANQVAQLQVPVSSNIVQAQGQAMVHGPAPYTVHVQFAHFTGVLVLGVGASAS